MSDTTRPLPPPQILVHQMQAMRNAFADHDHDHDPDADGGVHSLHSAPPPAPFRLQTRSQDLQYYIDQADWGRVQRLHVRCAATVDGFPLRRRQTEVTVEVGVPNTLSNERLVNPKNAGECECESV